MIRTPLDDDWAALQKYPEYALAPGLLGEWVFISFNSWGRRTRYCTPEHNRCPACGQDLPRLRGGRIDPTITKGGAAMRIDCQNSRP